MAVVTDPDKPPRTLADMIPEEPEPPRRRRVSRADRDRLDALERAVRDTEPEAVHRSKSRQVRGDRAGRDLNEYYENKGWKSPKRGKRGGGRLIFWAIVIMFVIAFVID